MGSSKLKTRYVAECSVIEFFRRHSGSVYYWTFTLLDASLTKGEAVKRFRPLADRWRRRKGEWLLFWERQKRGAWHVHVLVSCREDVIFLRQWMVARGWGQQMRVEWFRLSSLNGVPYVNFRVLRYLLKYVTKSVSDDFGDRLKPFGGCMSARVGTTRFAWMPEENPSAYLYYWGRQLFFELEGRQPSWRETASVLRLGAECTGWLSIDPWWMPLGP